MNNEELIEVVRSLVGTCITTEDAGTIIGKLVASQPVSTTLDFTTQTKGIAELAGLNLISRDQAYSWSKVIAETYMASLITPTHKSGTDKPGTTRAFAKRTYRGRLFQQGELEDEIILAINEGHNTIEAISVHLAKKFGYEQDRVMGTVSSKLSGMKTAGRAVYNRDPTGLKHWIITEYKSAKQAGTENFQSRQSVENELKGQ